MDNAPTARGSSAAAGPNASRNDPPRFDSETRAVDGREANIHRHHDLIDNALRQVRVIGDAAPAGADSSDATRAAVPQPAAGYALVFPGYDVVREVHRGGQGVVYEAVQRSTMRTVAIKVMRSGPLASAAERARFDREVQLLAQLRHPNIVTIYDSGRSADFDYFVMDYVEGAPLDHYVERAHISLDARLRLITRIAQAVNVAHLRGVIHRDLKPNNIRVDDAGEPHVLDFGLAKVVESPACDSSLDAMTMTGQFVGSLPWASPEQAEGRLHEIDLRTDVYALGVMLYRLLTGAFPYPVSASLRETTHSIVNVEPRDPRTLNAALDADLATIVLKCLRKNREHRYETAGELARDLERYLNRQPIEARRDSVMYVMRKHVARYRLVAGVATAAVVLMSVLLATTIAFWRQASLARDAEQQQRRRAQLEVAAKNAINAFLTDMLGAADPERSAGPRTTVEEMLAAAVAGLDKGKLADEPLVEAGARTTLGRTFMRLALLDQAEQQIRRALELRRAHGATPLDLAVSHTDHGMLAKERGTLDEAITHYRQALTLLESSSDAGPRELMSALNNLALALRAKGEHAAAGEALERVVAIDRQTLGPDDPELAVSLNNLALALRDAGDNPRAEACWREALAILRKSHGEDNLRVAAVLESLSAISLDRRDFPAALTLQRQANAIRDRVLDEDHPHKALGLSNLGHTLFLAEDYAAAEQAHLQALEMRRRLLPPDHPALATSLNHLGLVLTKKGQYAAAEQLYRDALAIRLAKLGPDHALTLLQQHNLANVMRLAGRPLEAEALVSDVVRRGASVLRAGHAYRALFRGEWGACLAVLGRFADAERELLAAHQEALTATPSAPAQVDKARAELFALYEQVGNTTEAARWRAAP